MDKLKGLSILDSLSEAEYDDLTEVASQICETPISLVSLVDETRQWFKSRHGLAAEETPREYAFCAHAINEPAHIFEVEDARQDERFHDNPLVTEEPNVIFYAGVPLVTNDGHALGTLCVIDNQPKKLTDAQKSALNSLARQCMKLIELRGAKKALETTKSQLESKNQELERFAHHAAHDLKSPLNGISSLAGLFLKGYGEVLDDDGKEMMRMLNDSAENLKQLVDGLLAFSKDAQVLNAARETVQVVDLEQELLKTMTTRADREVHFESSIQALFVNRHALNRILVNLVSNAIKYSDKEVAIIRVKISDDTTRYLVEVSDNGPGIKAQHQERIFGMFQVLNNRDKYGERGNGLGLAMVKKLVEGMGGNIAVKSEFGQSATFHFSLEK